MCSIATSASLSVGQEAVVKVESFPFVRYGAIHAHVARIAKDAIPEPDAAAIEGDPARVSNASGFAGAERTQNLVFPIVLKLDAATIAVDGVDEPLSSGMAVTVELKTGAPPHARIPLRPPRRSRLPRDARKVTLSPAKFFVGGQHVRRRREAPAEDLPRTKIC